MFRNMPHIIAVTLCFVAVSAMGASDKNVYFGDTHLHTSNSFDAYLMFNRDAGPDTAYRWAKGQAVIHPYTRTRVQIKTPLDFLVIADHAEFLGVMPGIDDGTVEFDNLGWWASVKRWVAVQWMEHVLGKTEFNYEDFHAIVPSAPGEGSADPTLEQANKDYIENTKLQAMLRSQ